MYGSSAQLDGRPPLRGPRVASSSSSPAERRLRRRPLARPIVCGRTGDMASGAAGLGTTGLEWNDVSVAVLLEW